MCLNRLVFDREVAFYPGSLTRRGLDFDFGIDQGATLLHDAQAKSRRLLLHSLEATPVIAYRQISEFTFESECNLDARGLGMFNGIIERFLGDAVEVQRAAVVEYVNAFPDFQDNRDLGA